MSDGESASAGCLLFIIGGLIGSSIGATVCDSSWKAWEKKDAVRRGEAYYDKTTGKFTRIEKGEGDE